MWNFSGKLALALAKSLRLPLDTPPQMSVNADFTPYFVAGDLPELRDTLGTATPNPITTRSSRGSIPVSLVAFVDVRRATLWGVMGHGILLPYRLTLGAGSEFNTAFFGCSRFNSGDPGSSGRVLDGSWQAEPQPHCGLWF